jgi:hypothetical protein
VLEPAEAVEAAVEDLPGVEVEEGAPAYSEAA